MSRCWLVKPSHLLPPLQHPCCPSTCGQLDEVEEDHRHLKASLRGTSHHGRSIRSRSDAAAFTQLRVGTGDITRSSGAARPRTPHRSSYGNEPAGEEGGERREERGRERGGGGKKTNILNYCNRPSREFSSAPPARRPGLRGLARRTSDEDMWTAASGESDDATAGHFLFIPLRLYLQKFQLFGLL